MARELLSGHRFAVVGTLPAAASNTGVVLEQANKLWFSNGTSWIDLGITTKNGIGLGNVDNTSDAAKPVSTPQQTALDLKAHLAGATFTGTVSGTEFKWTAGTGTTPPTDDVNSIIRPGFFGITNTTINRPTGAGAYGTVIASNFLNNTRVQLYLEVTPGAPNNAWIRHTDTYTADGTVYNAWSKLWHDGNDGAGSGLDADLLDGLESTRFVQGSSANRTTPQENLNTAAPSGFYESSAGTNGPVAGWNWYLNHRHSEVSNQYGWQLSNAISTNDFYVRGISAGTFLPWVKLYHTGNADLADSGWIAPTLLNSWVNYGGAYSNAGYRKFGKEVRLRGLVASGTITDGTILFTLPVGYRPPGRELFSLRTDGGIVRIEVDALGNVLILTYTGTTAFFTLAGIRFSID